MKLSEYSTDSAMDLLCELTPYINNIVTDEKLLSELNDTVSKGETLTKSAIYAAGVKKINAIVPIVLKTHKSDVYGIIAAVNGTSPESIASQNVLKTMSQIKDIAKDKELVSFFKSCGDMEV